MPRAFRPHCHSSVPLPQPVHSLCTTLCGVPPPPRQASGDAAPHRMREVAEHEPGLPSIDCPNTEARHYKPPGAAASVTTLSSLRLVAASAALTAATQQVSASRYAAPLTLAACHAPRRAMHSSNTTSGKSSGDGAALSPLPSTEATTANAAAAPSPGRRFTNRSRPAKRATLHASAITPSAPDAAAAAPSQSSSSPLALKGRGSPDAADPPPATVGAAREKASSRFRGHGASPSSATTQPGSTAAAAPCASRSVTGISAVPRSAAVTSVDQGEQQHQSQSLRSYEVWSRDGEMHRAVLPNMDTATPEELCSYLQTVRRTLSKSSYQSSVRTKFARRAYYFFLEEHMAQRMQSPSSFDRPAPTSPPPPQQQAVQSSQAAERPSAVGAGAGLAEPSVRDRDRSDEEGARRIPWTEELAEAVLLIAIVPAGRAEVPWSIMAALQVLTRATPSAVPDTGTPRLSVQRAAAKAQLALALLQLLHNFHRLEQMQRQVLEPQVARTWWLSMETRAAISQRRSAGAAAAPLSTAPASANATDAPAVTSPPVGVTESGGGGGGTVTSAEPRAAVPLPEFMAALSCFLSDQLLPHVYDQLVFFCGEVEARYAAEVEKSVGAAASATSSADEGLGGLGLRHESLPEVTPAEESLLALLLSVLYRATGQHAVVLSRGEPPHQSGDPAGSFVFRFSPGGWTPTPHHSSAAEANGDGSRRLPQLSPQAYAITLAATAAAMDRRVGPQTQLLEQVRRRRLKGRVAAISGDDNLEDAASRPLADTVAGAEVAAASQRVSGDASAGKASRFQRQRTPQRATATGGDATEGSARRSCGKASEDTEKRSAQSKEAPPRSRATHKEAYKYTSNYNVQPLESILKFCFHSHTRDLFVGASSSASHRHRCPAPQPRTDASSAPAGPAGRESAQSAALDDAVTASLADAIAFAHHTFLRLGLYWAPLFRTSQLPSVVRALSSTLSPATPTATPPVPPSDAEPGCEDTAVPPCGESHAGAETDRRVGRTPRYVLLSVAVQRRQRALLLDSCAGSAGLLKLYHRLVQSSLGYIKQHNQSSFTATAASVSRLFAQWPAEVFDPATGTPSRRRTGTVERECEGGEAARTAVLSDCGDPLCYPLPRSATTEVIEFAQLLEALWMNSLTSHFLFQVPRRDKSGALRGGSDGAASVALAAKKRSRNAAGVPAPQSLLGKRVTFRISPHTVDAYQRCAASGMSRADAAQVLVAELQRLAKTQAPAGRAADGGAAAVCPPAVTSANTRFSIWTPSFMWDTLQGYKQSYLSLSPAAMISLLGATRATNSFLAVPAASGSCNGALALLQPFLAYDTATLCSSGTELAQLLCLGLWLEKANRRLPVLLGIASSPVESGVMAGRGDAAAATAAPLLPSLSITLGSIERLAPGSLMKASLLVRAMVRVNPLTVSLTREGRLRSPLVRGEYWCTTSAYVTALAVVGISGETAVRLLREKTPGGMAESSSDRYVLRLLDTHRLWLANPADALMDASHVTMLLRHVLISWMAEGHLVPSARNATTAAGARHEKQQPSGFGLSLSPTFSSHGAELFLRAAHRFLFSPHEQQEHHASRSPGQPVNSDGGGDGAVESSRPPPPPPAPEQAAPPGDVPSPFSPAPTHHAAAAVAFPQDDAASAELLVLLYVAIHAGLRAAGELPPPAVVAMDRLRCVGDAAASMRATRESARYMQGCPVKPQPVATVANTPAALRCSLIHCEALLCDRLASLLGRESRGDGASLRLPGRETWWRTAEGLFQTCLLLESGWPTTTKTLALESWAAAWAAARDGCGDAAGSCTTTVPQLLCAVYERELRASLRQWSLQELAAVLSADGWWTAQRQQLAAANMSEGAEAAGASSWVEEAILDALAEKLASARHADLISEADGASAGAGSHRASATPSFELFEWTLMPFYVKLERRQRAAAAALHRSAAVTLTEGASGAATFVSSGRRLFDDFTALEEYFSPDLVHSQKSKASSAAPLGSPVPRAPGSVTACSTAALLEAALHSLVAHCTSMDVLLHVVRHLFLTHPALLSTAPNTAVELNAEATALVLRRLRERRGGDPASAAPLPEQLSVLFTCGLPQQWVEVPQRLRAQYVETLFRIFKRVVCARDTALEDIVELIHVLWLADTRLSRPDLTVASGSGGDAEAAAAVSPPRTRARRSATAAAAPLPNSWPSLFELCADVIVDNLHADHDEARWGAQDTAPEGGERQTAAPLSPAIGHLRAVVERGVDGAGIWDMLSLAADGVSAGAVALSPASVVRFLSSVATRVQAEAMVGGGTAPMLSHSQQALLDLLTPFILYAVSTAGPYLQMDRAAAVAPLVELLSVLDPSLIMAVIHAAFGGGAHGATAPNALSWSQSQKKGRKFNMAALGTTREARAEAVAGLVATIVAVANNAQVLAPAQTHDVASGLAPEPPGPAPPYAGGDVADGELDEAAMGQEDVTPDGTTPPVRGTSGPAGSRASGAGSASHYRAVGVLMFELRKLLATPDPGSLLSQTDPSLLIQLLQISAIRGHYKSRRTLGYAILTSMTVAKQQRVTSGGVDDNAGDGKRPSTAAGSTAAASESNRDAHVPSLQAAHPAIVPQEVKTRREMTLTPLGELMLRQLPLWLWQELLYRGHHYRIHNSFSNELHASMKKRYFTASIAHVAMQGTGVFVTTSGSEHDAVRPGTLLSEFSEPLVPAKGFGVTAVSGQSYRVSYSAFALLDTLDAVSVRRLVTHVMAPTVLLTVTADLLRREWWKRAGDDSADGAPPVAAADASRVAGGVGAADGVSALGVTIPAGSSYAHVLRYASANSVLRVAALQPFLQASLAVLDALASSDPNSFVAVLARDAEWRQLLQRRNGAMPSVALRSAGGGAHDSGSSADQLGRQAEGSSSGVEPRSGEVTDPAQARSGEEEEEEDGDGELVQDVTATPLPASTTHRELVLDWQPIVKLVQLLYVVDPALAEAPATERWLARLRHQGANHVAYGEESVLRKDEKSVDGEEGQRDVFHDGIVAITERASRMWQSAALAGEAAVGSPPSSDRVDGAADAVCTGAISANAPRLVMLNVHSVLDLYAPLLRTADGTPSHQLDRQHVASAHPLLPGKAPSARGVAAPLTGPVVLHSRAAQHWLATHAAASGADRQSLLRNVADVECSRRPLACTLRSSVDVPLQHHRVHRPARVHRAVQLRRMQLLTMGGVVRTPRAAAERCAALGVAGARSWDVYSGSSKTKEEEEEDNGRADGHSWDDAAFYAYWRAKSHHVQACILKGLFSAPHEPGCRDDSVRVSSAHAECTPALQSPLHPHGEAALERWARRRLELLRCDDVARLLTLLLQQQGSDALALHSAEPSDVSRLDAAAPSVRVVQVRILMDTLAELLATASSEEVLRVTHTLLVTFVRVAEAAVVGAPVSAESETSGAAAQATLYDLRRLLSIVGVLVANDPERFTLMQLVWLLSRLHTPRLRVRLAPSLMKGTTPTAAAAAVTEAAELDAAMDVDESFLTAAVARSILAWAKNTLHDGNPTARPEVIHVPSDEGEAGARAVASRAVTMREWLGAVEAAEMLCNAQQLSAVLDIIEATAL